MEDDDKELTEAAVRMTVRTAKLQIMLAEFPEDLADAARRAARVRSLFAGPTDPTVVMWPMEEPE